VEAEGQKVRLLAILDTWIEENTRYKPLFVLLAGWHLLRKALRNPGQASKKLLAKMFPKQRTAAAAATPAGSTRGAAERPNMWRKYFPGRDFHPPVYSGKITVFRLPKQAFYRIRDNTLGWRTRTTATVETDTMVGGHTTFLREPHVQVLTAKLAARLQTNAAVKLAAAP
jgi:thioesterase domain-containing protein